MQTYKKKNNNPENTYIYICVLVSMRVKNTSFCKHMFLLIFPFSSSHCFFGIAGETKVGEAEEGIKSHQKDS